MMGGPLVTLVVLGSFNFFREVVVKFSFEDLIMFISSALAFYNLTRSTTNLPLVIQPLKWEFFFSISVLIWLLNRGGPCHYRLHSYLE